MTEHWLSETRLVITKLGRKWILFSKTGKKILGTHPTKRAAEAQEHAINIAKARRAGHRIPYLRK